jgi:hypothetical protein
VREASPAGGFCLPPARAWWEAEERHEALEVLQSVWRATGQASVEAAFKKLKSNILSQYWRHLRSG